MRFFTILASLDYVLSCHRARFSCDVGYMSLKTKFEPQHVISNTVVLLASLWTIAVSFYQNILTVLVGKTINKKLTSTGRVDTLFRG